MIFVKLLRRNWPLNAMSKKTKTKGSKISEPTKTETLHKELGPISLNKDNNILIQIYAKPGAKQNCIKGISYEGVNVQINAPPTEGAANTELVKYVASVLGLRSSNILLERGHKSRLKVLRISGIVLEDVKKKIDKEIRDGG